MRNRILIVDDQVTQAIQLKVKLANSLYDVEIASSLAAARGVIAAKSLLMVLVSDRVAPIGALLIFCSEVAALNNAPPLMVFGTSTARTETHANAMLVLASGAQEYLSLPMDEAEMMARVRSLVRQGFERWHLPSARPGGEPVSSICAARAVALVSPTPSEAVAWRVMLQGRLPHPVKAMRATDLMQALRQQQLPAAIVLAAAEGQMADLRLLAELKARFDTADIPVLILGGATGDFAILALDLGAQDVLSPDLDPAELALRLRLRLAQQDRLRQRQRDTAERLRQAAVDPLTGLANRRAAFERLEAMQNSFSHGGSDYALLLLDIDRFKEVNDTFGHAAGDAVLIQVAQRITAAVREADLVGRIGGEEFLVALRGAGLSEACRIAERLRHSVAATPCHVPGGERVAVTISIGLCQPEAQQSYETVLARADQALYVAKKMGRNVVEVSV